MIKRYSRKELVDIWDEYNKYKIWLNIEIAAAEGMEKIKLIPKGVASIVKKKGKIKVKRIHQIENSEIKLIISLCEHENALVSRPHPQHFQYRFF